jgi:tetratricopeptide (TPR) repeat protein
MKECRERCERALLSLEPHVNANMRQRMRLRINLADVLITTMGPASVAIAVMTPALEDAETLDDLDAQAWALNGLWNAFIFRDDYARARIVVERLGRIADRIDDSASFCVVYRLMGNALFMSGKPREAQGYYERALRSPVAPGDRHGAIYYNSNELPVVRAMLARALWIQGFIEKALDEARVSLEELHCTDHPLLLCRALHYGICCIAPMIGDFATADREIARMIEVATSLDAHFWETAGRFLKGKLLVERGEFAQGLLILRDAFETCGRTGWRLSYPEFKGDLALAFAGLGRLDEALGALEDAVASAGEGENGQVWYVPELLRIKGEVLLLQATDQSVLAAEDCFNQAGEMAREQDALFWELRIALSVARLRMIQGRDGEAKQILSPVYGRFTDRYETTDLRTARTMLDGLPS